MTVQKENPKRIQRKRTKGWRMPEGAVYVGRPTQWGNPWRFNPLSAASRRVAVAHYRGWATAFFAVDTPIVNYLRADLRGHDLACWCPLEDENGNRVPCHADVLLELANR